VLRAGRVLDQSTVASLDALAFEWRQQGTQIRYRIQLDASPPGSGWGLWIYSMGGPYRAWVDGKPAQPIDPVAVAGLQVYNGRIPALFQLPQGASELVIEIVELVYAGSGLIYVGVGPQAALLASRAVSQRVIIGLNEVSSTMIGMAGVLIVALQRAVAAGGAIVALGWVAIVDGDEIAVVQPLGHGQPGQRDRWHLHHPGHRSGG
jgi:hypothetical protein